MKKILVPIVVIVVGLLIAIMAQPSSMGVSRSSTMAASPDIIFSRINSYKEFVRWNPWLAEEPGAKSTFEGPETGVGAIYRWSGEKIGAGSMEIIESVENDHVTSNLVFEGAGAGQTSIFLTSQGDMTKVTWTMKAKHGFVQKAFSLVMDMEGMIGEKYELGLKKLQALVEPEAQKREAEAKLAEKASADAGVVDAGAVDDEEEPYE